MSTSPALIRGAGDQPVAVDGADDEAGQVVLAIGVEARHLAAVSPPMSAQPLARQPSRDAA